MLHRTYVHPDALEPHPLVRKNLNRLVARRHRPQAVPTTITESESQMLGRCIAVMRARRPIDPADEDAAIALRIRLMEEYGTLLPFDLLPGDQKEAWVRLVNKPGA